MTTDRLALSDNVATKQDIAAVRADIATVQADVSRVGVELNARIDLIEHRLITRLGGLMVVLAGLLFAALRYTGHG